MNGTIGILLLIQVILILLNAIFASAEIAVLSMNEAKLTKLASQGDKRAKRLARLTDRPAKFLATIQVAITLSGFLGSAFAADNFSDGLVDWLLGLGAPISRNTLDTIAVVFITIVLSYFTLIFGELVPKRIAMKKSEQLALGLSGLLSMISSLFAPLVWFLSASTNAVLRLFGIDPNEADEQVSEEEIRLLVDAGSANGAIDREEKQFIQNVFEFDDLTAGEIATHRTDVLFLWMEDSMDEWDETIHSSRHTLYPVCQDSPDNIVGILNAKDYFRLKDKSRESVMENAVRPAHFVPEAIKADVLFRNMRENRISLAVVLDEYGGISGIVTIHDLVEELVGSLKEADEESLEAEPFVKPLSEDTFAVHGNVTLRELEEATGLELDEEDCGTFTGLVFHLLGNVPKDGDQEIRLELPTCSLLVTRIENHQVAEATVQVKPSTETAEE